MSTHRHRPPHSLHALLPSEFKKSLSNFLNQNTTCSCQCDCFFQDFCFQPKTDLPTPLPGLSVVLRSFWEHKGSESPSHLGWSDVRLPFKRGSPSPQLSSTEYLQPAVGTFLERNHTIMYPQNHITQPPQQFSESPVSSSPSMNLSFSLYEDPTTTTLVSNSIPISPTSPLPTDSSSTSFHNSNQIFSFTNVQNEGSSSNNQSCEIVFNQPNEYLSMPHLNVPSQSQETITNSELMLGLRNEIVSVPSRNYLALHSSIEKKRQSLTKERRTSKKRKFKKRKWSHEDMTLAMQLVQERCMSARAAAMTCNVPRSTLWDRLSGRVTHGVDNRRKKPKIDEINQIK
jgi:hypothetical protein